MHQPCLMGTRKGFDMPSKSPAQARLMAAVAHDPKFAKRVGIPQSVGREYNKADTGTKMLSRATKKSNPGTDRIK